MCHDFIQIHIMNFINNWLVVWNMNFIFPFSWECHHPNWGLYTTNRRRPPRVSRAFPQTTSWSSLGVTELGWRYHQQTSRDFFLGTLMGL